MAGLTPFQFSSNKLQNMNSKIASTDPTKKSLLSDTYQTVASWYEMWINPMNVSIRDNFIQQTEHTAGAVVTYHFRKDLGIMEVKGVAGWVAIQSDLEKLQNDTMSALRHPKSAYSNIKKIGAQSYKDIKKKVFDNPFNNNSDKTNKLNNSPRKFLERLRDLAYEPTYYFDREGREHYNAKYVKMYTKQYPNGVICEGFFKDFTIPESEDDVQTINYSFTFVIQNMEPVTLIQKVGGMFSPLGSTIGGGLGLI